MQALARDFKNCLLSVTVAATVQLIASSNATAAAGISQRV
jgi:hypothetical protein